MSENALHLPNLTIRRFRGIQDLSIERLGRVTLIAGKNGVGKTTVLDAVRTYAARGQYAVLSSILGKREELTRAIGEDGDERLAFDLESLFYGRRVPLHSPIVIGPTGNDQYLSMEATVLDEREVGQWAKMYPEHLPDADTRQLKVTFNGEVKLLPLVSSESEWLHKALVKEPERSSGIRCESLGPNVLSNEDIARLWDKIALTDDENRAVEALRLIIVDTVERAAVIGDESKSRFGRRAMARLAGQKRPVPLRSLGDGAVRLFGVALALANSQGGFLLIDEVENGIHHTLQRDFWRMVLLTAQANNVQVFATTHSWDCVAGFAQAAVAEEGAAGALVRLERDGEHTRAVTYPEHELHAAADHGIEVR